MGYCKIVQYGDTTEIYKYENKIKQRKPSPIVAERLVNGEASNHEYHTFDVTKKRRKLLRLQSQEKGVYKRTDRSVRRSRENFFRLCHHNNCLADTIHFITLTFIQDVTTKKASRYVSEFFRRIQTYYPEIPLSYISVPEWTKKGRLHYHLLVYDLPAETSQLERKTRNFQRFFRRGYVDFSLAPFNSAGLAGYMSKYMAKSITDSVNGTRRGYNCSRNIIKFRSSGSNSDYVFADMIIPTENIVEEEEREYDVPYLGKCQFKKIVTK